MGANEISNIEQTGRGRFIDLYSFSRDGFARSDRYLNETKGIRFN